MDKLGGGVSLKLLTSSCHVRGSKTSEISCSVWLKCNKHSIWCWCHCKRTKGPTVPTNHHCSTICAIIYFHNITWTAKILLNQKIQKLECYSRTRGNNNLPRTVGVCWIRGWITWCLKASFLAFKGCFAACRNYIHQEKKSTLIILKSTCTWLYVCINNLRCSCI